MGRTRTPTSVLKLRGAFINHPSRGRDRENEPIIARALPAPPRYLESAMVQMWLEMKSRGYWLTSADKFLVEIAASLMARYRIDELKSGDVSQLIGLLGKIGFSPGERGKMSLPAKRSGAPRPMKMGNTLSPWRYDPAARHALESANLRRPAIVRYASWEAVFPISQAGPVALR
jgi:hypothetical protein